MPAPARMARARFRHGSWPTRLRTGSIVFLALCVLALGSGYAYFRYQVSRINRVKIPGLADDDSNNVMNVLLVGSDTRDTATGDIADATGKGDAGTSGQRSDTIMILHIDPNAQRAAILSIPRDLYVPIGGTGSKDKINASFSIGGPQLLIDTIKQTLGIDINHYVEVDFESFSRIVDTVGGVKVWVDEPARDTMTGLDLPVAGCNELDGYQALAFVRSRYYETYEKGRWVSGTNSDLDRITRQQDFIRRMMKKAVSSGLSNPLTLNRLVNIGVSNLRVDQSMSSKDITTVARKFRAVDPDAVDMLTLPTTDAFIGGAAVELLDISEAQEYIDRLNGVPDDSNGVKPADVAVDVLNGNGADASASKAASALTQAGFRVAATGDADTYDYAQTVVRYAPGRQAKAALVRNSLSAGAVVQSDPTLVNADVALILGSDYTGVHFTGPSATQPSGSTDSPATGAPAGGPGPTTTVAAHPPC